MEEFLRKFQVPQVVGEQAREYHRLAEVKCSAAVRGLSSTALALICIELACTQLGEPIDKVPATGVISLCVWCCLLFLQQIKFLKLVTWLLKVELQPFLQCLHICLCLQNKMFLPINFTIQWMVVNVSLGCAEAQEVN